MWKIYSKTFVSLGALTLGCLSASAQVNTTLDSTTGPIIVPSTSSSFNQQGFNLPSTPRQTGQDIVRGSGGISCHSSVGGNGPVLDLGVIGTNDIYSRDSTALYGRITVPLGRKPKRVDCTKLYDLEISRLKMELKLMQATGSMGGFDDMGAQQAYYDADRAMQSGLTTGKTGMATSIEENFVRPESSPFTVPSQPKQAPKDDEDSAQKTIKSTEANVGQDSKSDDVSQPELKNLAADSGPETIADMPEIIATNAEMTLLSKALPKKETALDSAPELDAESAAAIIKAALAIIAREEARKAKAAPETVLTAEVQTTVK